MIMITQAFRQSDNARSFVRALEARDYVLATGRVERRALAQSLSHRAARATVAD